MDIPFRRLAGPALTLLVAASAAGPAEAVERPIYRVFAFGDSYGSGEGAPGTPGTYRQDGTVPNPRAVWSGTTADRAFTGDVETGLTGARRCHRSPLATAPKAVRLLQTRFPDVSIVFRSFACSGGRIDIGVLKPFEGIELDDGTGAKPDTTPKVPSQISQANDLLGTLPEATRRIDALVMNIGGNNLGFADVIATCVSLDIAFNRPAGTPVCSPKSESDSGGDDRATRIFETGAGSTNGDKSIGLDGLPALFTSLRSSIRGTGSPELAVRPRDVFLSSPPSVLGGDFDGCANLTGQFDYENRLRVDERRWLNGNLLPRFVGAMRDGAANNGWDFVDMLPAFTNGICTATGRNVNRNKDALPVMGAVANASFGINVSTGFAHPNAAGFAAMGIVLADAMQPRLLTRFTPPVPSAVTMVEKTNLESRVEASFTYAPTDFPQRPSVQLPTATRIAGTIGFSVFSFVVPSTGSLGVVTLPFDACGPVGNDVNGPRACSMVRRNAEVMTGTPGIPELTSAEVQSDGTARVRWRRSNTAVGLRRFVVEVEQQPADQFVEDPACGLAPSGGAVGGQPRPVGESGPSCQTVSGPGLPPARYSFGNSLREAIVTAGPGQRVSVRECTDRGCGSKDGADLRSAPPSFRSAPAGVRLFGPAEEQLLESPLGLVAGRVPETVTRGRRTSMFLGWRAWEGWKSLRRIDVELRDARGRLGTLQLDPGNGDVVLRGRGGKARHGNTTDSRILRSGALRLDARRARLVRNPANAAFELPLTLGRAAIKGPIEVKVGATSLSGRRQTPRQVSRFVLR